MIAEWFCPNHHSGFMVFVYGGKGQTMKQYCTQCLREKLKSGNDRIIKESAERDARGLNGRLRYLMVQNRIAAPSQDDSHALKGRLQPGNG